MPAKGRKETPGELDRLARKAKPGPQDLRGPLDRQDRLALRVPKVRQVRQLLLVKARSGLCALTA